MGEPNLYGRYDRDEAITRFGPDGASPSLCNGQWVVLPDVVLCFAELGEQPGGSHFTNGGQFCWVADKPCPFAEDRQPTFVPSEVVGRNSMERVIRLFVRPSGVEKKYLYVGKVGPPYIQHFGKADRCDKAYFGLSPTLPSEVWVGLGGLKLGHLDHAGLDAALASLRLPTTIGHRLEVLRHIVEYWHGPIHPDDGIPGSELSRLVLPKSLRWWYQLAGRRTDIMSGQNRLMPPDRLSVADGKWLFYVENQGCYLWGTEPEGDDPPVFGRVEASGPWEPEGIVLSEHLLLASLFEAIGCHSPYGASTAWLEGTILERIIEHIPPIPVKPWRWCGSTRFYARNGAFMFTMPNGEKDGVHGDSVWVGAKTEHPLQFLKPFIDENWEYAAI